MSVRHKRTKAPRWQHATALLPLALLAGGWTASLGSSTTASAEAPRDRDVPAIPTTAFDQPASYTDPTSIDPSNPLSNPNLGLPQAGQSSLSANGIPTAALSAYQRAATVLGQADSGCNLSWALVAAIGRIESDHGRFGGNILSADGKSTPGIYGVPLDGTNGTAYIADTDNGRYDRDPIFDRAVGAMQFIPSTWEMVGVDSDADGSRDPQDIDDASLASAVYLCAGSEDLNSAAGQSAAVFRYNHSQEYVDLVLAIMRSYLAGDYTAVANDLPSGPYLGYPESNRPEATPRKPRRQPRPDAPAPDSDTTPPTTQERPPTQQPPADQPPPEQPPGEDTPTVAVPDQPDVTEPVAPTLTELQKATAACTTAFQDAGLDPTTAQLNGCIEAYRKGGLAAVNAFVAGLGGIVPGGVL